MADMNQILFKTKYAASVVRTAEREAREQAEDQYSTVDERVRYGALARILAQYADSLEHTAADEMWLREEVGK